MKTFLFDYRCSCGNLLFKGLLLDARLEIKCKKCGKLQELSDHYSRTSDRQYAMLFDRYGTIVDASGSVLANLGYEKYELLKLSAFDIAPDASKERYARLWDNLQQVSFSPLLVESFHKIKTGELVPVRCRLTFPVLRGEQHMLALCEVIDRDQESGDGSGFQPGTVVIQDLIAEVTSLGVLVYMSTELCSRLDYSVYEIIGKSIFDLLAKSKTNTFKYEFGLMADRRQSFSVPEISLRGKDGTEHAFCMNYLVEFYEDNTMKGFKIICTKL